MSEPTHTDGLDAAFSQLTHAELHLKNLERAWERERLLAAEVEALKAKALPPPLQKWLKELAARHTSSRDTDEPFELRGSEVTMGILRAWLALL